MTLSLAAGTTDATRLFSELVPWLVALLAVVVIGSVVILAIRKRLNPGESGSSAVGFTLHDLRVMHANGQLTDEEFEHAKEAMIGRVKAALQRDAEGEEAPDDTTENDESESVPEADPRSESP